MRKIVIYIFLFAVFSNFSVTALVNDENHDFKELKIKNVVSPGYPRRAMQKEIMGYAIVTFSVNKQGEVFNLKTKNVESFCTQDNPYDQYATFKECSTFNVSAVRAAEKLKYFPKLINDRPIDVDNVTHRFTYLIENEKTKDYIAKQRLAAMEKEEESKLKQKEIILAGLVRRCEGFGWLDDNDVAACVQQEAYRDLELEKQKQEIKILEQKLASAQTTYDEPLFISLLNMYANTIEKENINQIKRDIAVLKTKDIYDSSGAEAALKTLYRSND